MRRFFILALLSVFAVSCFKGTYYETSYTGADTFEYDVDNGEFPDSVYFKSASFLGGSSTNLQYHTSYTESSDSFDGGFAVSFKRDSSLVIAEDNRYPNLTAYPKSSLYTAGGAASSEGFVVFYDSARKPEHGITFTRSSVGTCSPVYCMIANTQPVVKYFKEEGSPAKDNGDYLKLTVTGYLHGTKTGEAEYYLADFRASADSVNVAWKTLSLSKLGSVDAVDFSLEASNDDIPRYFCLDNFVASIYIKEE